MKCGNNVAAVLKAKTGVDFRPRRVLGACNPQYAGQAFEAEPMNGVMLRCKIVVRQRGDVIETAAVAPVAPPSQVSNSTLGPLAAAVREHLRCALRAAASANDHFRQQSGRE